MKALVYEGPREMHLRQLAAPEPLEDEVLIRVAYSGICGSELSGFLGHNALRKPPIVFGHEFSGTVEALGERVVRNGLQVGARVTANPLVTCGECRFCLSGRQQLCPSRRLLSAALPGSNAELVKIPARFVYPLPNGMSLRHGALVEPVACGVRVAELAAPKPGERAVVAGMGPIGLYALQALKLYGVTDLYAIDLSPERLEIAESLGAIPIMPNRKSDVAAEVRHLTDGGADIAVDAVGASVTRRQCIDFTAPGGRVIVTGLHEAESSLQVNTMIRSEISLLGSFAYSAVTFEKALAYLANGWFGLDEWVEEAPLETGAAWFDRLIAKPGKTAKVLLVP